MGRNTQEWTETSVERTRAREEQERLRQQRDNAIQQRDAEVVELNKNLEARYWALQTILETGLARQPAIDFDALKDRTPYSPFVAPPHLSKPTPEPSLEAFTPAPLTFFGKLFGQQKHARRVNRELQAYQDAFIRHQQTERERLKDLEHVTTGHERRDRKHAEKLYRQHAKVDEFERRYRRGEPAAISSYCELVLAASPYPPGCPAEFQLAYIPDSKQVVVNYRLPPVRCNTGGKRLSLPEGPG